MPNAQRRSNNAASMSDAAAYSPAHAEAMLTASEVAKLLRVSARTVRRLINNQELRALVIRTGRMRLYRISPEALRDYIRVGEQPVETAGDAVGLVDIPPRNY